MKATQQLKDEHQGVLVMLSILEKICQKLELGEEIDIKHLDQILEFMKVFIDQCHHGKEEELLLPALAGNLNEDEVALVESILHDHQKGRRLVSNLTKDVDWYKNGEKESVKEITATARDYIKLLRAHIEREDGVLYEIADRQFSQEKQGELYEGFEKIETEKIGSGKHEQFHHLLDELGKIYEVNPQG